MSKIRKVLLALGSVFALVGAFVAFFEISLNVRGVHAAGIWPAYSAESIGDWARNTFDWFVYLHKGHTVSILGVLVAFLLRQRLWVAMTAFFHLRATSEDHGDHESPVHAH